MSISLTTKDADFILGFIRADLQRVVDNTANLDESWKRLEASCTDNIKDLSFVQGLMKIAGDARQMAVSDNNDIRKDLERCVELLTCGSEVSE